MKYFLKMINVLLIVMSTFLSAVFLLVSFNVNAAEKIEEAVLGMNVSGTKELPNVLYIVPWKANSAQLEAPQITRLVDEIYAPVDPEVFSKQVKFYYQLTAKKIEPVKKIKQVQ